MLSLLIICDIYVKVYIEVAYGGFSTGLIYLMLNEMIGEDIPRMVLFLSFSDMRPHYFDSLVIIVCLCHSIILDWLKVVNGLIRPKM